MSGKQTDRSRGGVVKLQYHFENDKDTEYGGKALG